MLTLYMLIEELRLPRFCRRQHIDLFAKTPRQRNIDVQPFRVQALQTNASCRSWNYGHSCEVRKKN